MRCGTSMMMQALEAGGMDAVYSRSRDDQMNSRFGDSDYVPNETYYELDRKEYQDPDFPNMYDGKLVKCLFGGLYKISPESEYSVIFMRRPKREIYLSLVAFFGQPSDFITNNNFDSEMDRCVDVMKDRRCVKSIIEVQYHDVVNDPYSVFYSLAATGWPIDPEKSSSIVDRGKARFSPRKLMTA